MNYSISDELFKMTLNYLVKRKFSDVFPLINAWNSLEHCKKISSDAQEEKQDKPEKTKK